MAAYESTHASTPMPTPRQSRLVWAAVLTAPLASLGDLQAGYTLALFACSRSARYLPLASTAMATLWVLAAIWYAGRFDSAREQPARGAMARYARLYEAAAGPSRGGPMGWVAVVAVVLNLMALLVVLAMAIPRVVLDPCWR